MRNEWPIKELWKGEIKVEKWGKMLKRLGGKNKNVFVVNNRKEIR